VVLLFVFGKYFAEICLKMQLFNIINLHLNLRDNQRYGKASYVYISPQNKSWLYCGLSHVQLLLFKTMTFLTVHNQ